ncbi:MAG: COX15/CtaA family protein [Saprospiraceae bacterium]|nr:COX15/CtaA family protein [Saprospiraceae bacterium]
MNVQVIDRKIDPRKIYSNGVRIWLFIGVFMVFMQIVIGGITRLTGSGLSITKWEIVTGTLPPLSAEAWDDAFLLYQDTPQYKKINEGMTLGAFKFIYFWEYFHRLWARLMGLVFAIPFLVFWRKGRFDKPLLKRLGVIILLAAIVASFGWIMVASGLIERPWVNAYKLTMHLSLALILYSYLFWTTLWVNKPYSQVIHNSTLKRWGVILISVLAFQLVLGGIMSGMRAALFYPTWPDMQGVFLPDILLKSENWITENFVFYDRGPFMSALIQFFHRNTAYLLTVIILYIAWKSLRSVTHPLFKMGIYMLVSVLVVQVILGILTLVNSVGTIPVGLGVLHQAVGILLLTTSLFVIFPLRKE